MSIATYTHNDVCKDDEIDRHVDIQTEGCEASGEDNACRVRDAFVVVLANHLCRIRHSWFCAESRVMPGRRSRPSGCIC